MATERQQKRKELREKRLQAEAKAQSGDNRQNLIKALAAVAFIAVVGVVVAAVLISTGGSDDTATSSKSNSDIEKLFAGIEQDGTVLGDPKAKLTVVEFGDLQCPVCKQFADKALPEVIEGPVRDGQAKLQFRNWAILGPDSNTAAKASLAASLQGRYWQFIETFYAQQGAEGTGYVTDEFLRSIAEQAGVPDLDKWEEDRNDPRWEDELFKNDEAAFDLGFSGTPGVALEDAQGKLTPIEDISPEGIKKAIDQAR